MNHHDQLDGTDPVLAAVLDAGEPGAPAWKQVLGPQDFAAAAGWAALAEEISAALAMSAAGLEENQRAAILDAVPASAGADPWAELAGELSNALRMGPGGLHDSQREKILEAAAHPVVLGTGPWIKPLPVPRPAIGSWWKWTAAAGMAATIAVVASRHAHFGGGIDAAAWAARLTPIVQPPLAYRVRMLPGEAFGSRYLDDQKSRSTPVASKGDWSAIGPGGGFQPVAMANMAEFVPMAAARQDVPLAELLRADYTAGAPWTAALINHFAYDYPEPQPGDAVSVSVEAGPCPWQPINRLVHIGLRASADPKIAPGRNGLVASDVRMVVDFNPRRVAAYRLVGYGPAARSGQAEQIVDAGADLLAGQLVTAIYEIVPAGIAPADGDGGAWTNPTGSGGDAHGRDILAAKVVYRQPGESRQRDRSVVLGDTPRPGAEPSDDFQFSAAVAAFGLLREQAPGMQRYALGDALSLARANIGADADGKRGEFVRMLAGATR